MTPSGWLTNEVTLFGVAWMFGGALVCAPVGWLVGRRRGVELGIGSGLVLWGLGNLVVVGMMALLVHVDSVVVKAVATRCEPATDGQGRPERTLFHTVQQPGAPVHEWRGTTAPGLCPEGPPDVAVLRLRRDALATSTLRIPAEPIVGDDDTPLAVMVTWGIFGAAGLLMGGLLSAQTGEGRPRANPAAAAPVAAWRQRLGILMSQLGGLVFLAAFIAPWFLPGSTERALQLGMRCVASALGLWLMAGLLARTMHVGAAVFLVTFGGAMLGFAELARRGG